MNKVEIVHDAEREASSGGRKAYTFTVDGVESLYWSPTRHAIERVVSRLQQGRSGEAFGGAGVATGGVVVNSRGHSKPARGKVVSAGEVTTETVATKSGRQKPREKRPGYLYELDGKAREDLIVTSEAEARQLLSFAAFGTRGRLGRFPEAEAAFKDKYGKDCKVQLLGRKIVAKDEGGGLWSVGLQEGHAPVFKPVVPPVPRVF